MARFYSPEWITDFNEAVDGLEVGTAADASVVAESGSFRVVQVVNGAPGEPGGDLRVALVLDAGRLHLERTGPDEPAGDVTVSLAYLDAAALSRGELDPAAALGQGRIKVRGDLAVLVAGQGILSAAAGRLAALQAATTY